MLGQYLPGVTVWVYGSRVRGMASRYADLDMVVFTQALHRRAVWDLREAFEESSLTFSVDLFVWDELPVDFQRNIERDHVELMVDDGGV